jgi:hypothetical protein
MLLSLRLFAVVIQLIGRASIATMMGWTAIDLATYALNDAAL